MALILTPEEQAALDKRVTNQPPTAEIPSDEDIINGSADPATDITLTPSSGLQQDIDAAQAAIDQANARLLELADEISMAINVTNYYTGITDFYKTETRYINGVFETSPWSLSEASEANNIFNNVSTRYFPSGNQTNPLQINSFAEETGAGATSTDANNVINRWNELEVSIDFFTTTYTNAERIADAPDGAIPPPTQQEIDDYEDAKQDIITKNSIILGIMSTYASHLAPPISDDLTAGADTDAAARLVEVNATIAILTELSGYSTFPDANLANFQAHRSLPVPQANARVAQIGTYPLSGYYGIRAAMAVELADFGEGLYYKKLQDEANIVQQTNRKAQLERKLATYQGI